MLRMRFVFLVIALGFHAAYAQQQASAYQQPPKQKQRGSDSLPLVVKIQATPQNQAETDKAQKEDADKKRAEAIKQKSDNDLVIFTEKLATYTLVLVVVGFIQAVILIVQLVFVGKQDKAIKALERAYVFIEIEPSHWVIDGPDNAILVARVKFWNHGKTPAVVRVIRGVLHPVPV